MLELKSRSHLILARHDDLWDGCPTAVHLRCSINTLFWGNQMNKITVRCGEWFSIGWSSACESASREPWEIQLYWSQNKSNSESCWLESVAIVYPSLVQVPCQMDPYMNGFVIQNMPNSHWFYVIIIFIHFSQRIEVAKNIHKHHKIGWTNHVNSMYPLVN